ncbi:cytochrome c oxidase assembly protein [Subtercola boreus]|uniref:cytochrome c oxidase assembly protein n=1 Tax=Subtercola boreus TaxID=120213 RepID=UPI000E2EF2C8|nr:cytochrome c oxidase assembly protein [Subtercola boreus]TQL46897.1 putative copper resistance protein D [Subtercola boreus]
MTRAPAPHRPHFPEPIAGRRRRLLAPIVLVGAALIVVTLLSAWVFGNRPALLVDTGAAVTYGLPLVKVLANLAAAATIGGLLLAGSFLSEGDPARGRAMDLSAVSAAVWSVLTGVYAVLTFITIAGPVRAGIFGPALGQYLTQVSLGQSNTVTILLTAVISVGAFASRKPVPILILTVVAFAALIPLALQGHAAGAGGHRTAAAALWLHVGFAGAWIGTLLILVITHLRAGPDVIRPLLRRFSFLALICFIGVTLSGAISASLRLNSVSELVSTDYGVILGLKMVVLVLLGAAGYGHRRWLISRLPAQAGRWNAVWVRLVIAEGLLMGVASGAAAVLARTPPPAGEVTIAVTTAEKLTGQALPLPFSPARLLDSFAVDPIWLTAGIFVIGLYAAGVHRLRRAGTAWPARRSIGWVAGWAVIIYLTNAAPAAYENYLFTAYAAGHLALGALTTFLIIAGRPLLLISRTADVRNDGTGGVRGWLNAAATARIVDRLLHPVVAAALFVLCLLTAFTPLLVNWSLTDPVGHQWNTTQLFLAGCLLVCALNRTRTHPITRGTAATAMAVLGAGVAVLVLLVGAAPVFLPEWYGVIGDGWQPAPMIDHTVATVTFLTIGTLFLITTGTRLIRRPSQPGVKL